MSKYNSLWAYIRRCGQDAVTLTFEEIADIAGVAVDHSFLTYKKELTEYGWKVAKISMKSQKISFQKIAVLNTLVVYVHGKGGNAGEAEHYKPLFPCCDVVGLDYQSNTPWNAKTEFSVAFQKLAKGYKSLVLVANSIGAYFSMCALPQEKIEKAYFISPIVDMEKLIYKMMRWANVSESNLESRGTVPTEFGETLSWQYLNYVRTNSVRWNVPTKILYGENDGLTDKETITAFAAQHNATLTVMSGGEHWFHTEEQMSFLDDWIKNDVK